MSIEEVSTYYHGGKAVKNTNDLMEAAGTNRDEWQKEGDNYNRFKSRAAIKTPQKLQARIIHTIAERSVEKELLNRWLGQNLAQGFQASLNNRWNVLDGLV